MYHQYLLVHLVEVAVHRGRRLIPVPPHGPLGQNHAHAHAALRRGPCFPAPSPPTASTVTRSAAFPLPRRSDRPAGGRPVAGVTGSAARDGEALDAVVALRALVMVRRGGPLHILVAAFLDVFFVGIFGGVLRGWKMCGEWDGER